jgi:hypothetical protein
MQIISYRGKKSNMMPGNDMNKEESKEMKEEPV